MQKSSAVLGFMLIGQVLIAQSIDLEVEPNHSTVGFSLSIAEGFTRVTGKFTDYNIDLTYVDQDILKSSFRASIKVGSIQTGIADRDAHLKSADFFDAEQFSEITFESRSVEQRGEDYIASGPFTMHGITKIIEIPFQVTKIDGNTIGFSSETKVNRMDFEVGKEFEHTAIKNFLPDKVDVHIYFWTRKRKSK